MGTQQQDRGLCSRPPMMPAGRPLLAVVFTAAVAAAFKAPCPDKLGEGIGAVSVSLDRNATLPFVFWKEDPSTTFGVEACGVSAGSYQLKTLTAGGRSLAEQSIKVHGNSITIVQLPAPAPTVQGVASFVLESTSGSATFARDPCGNKDACKCSFHAACASEQEWRHTRTCYSGYGGNGTSCSACQPGSSKAEEENAPCDQCDAGTFSNSSAALECHTCPANTFSSAGSSMCIPCARGAMSAPGSAACVCKPGWSGDGSSCTEIDNCRLNATFHECDEAATCTYTGPGENTCACNKGFTGDGNGCTEIDNCQDDWSYTGKWGGCHKDGECTKTGPGENTCACNFGFSGDGTKCVEINACLTPGMNDCHSKAVCKPTGPGLHSCTCKAGHTGDGKKSCEEIDLCAHDNGNCTGLCTKTGPGLRRCSCKAGTEPEAGSDSQCRPCPSGTWKSSVSNTRCIKCARGKSTNGVQGAIASQKCSECASNTFVPTKGTGQCQSCPVGAYSAAGAHQCHCKPGYRKLASADNSFSCAPCNASTYASDTDSPSCKVCPGGTFADQVASKACTPCPYNFVSPKGGGATQCQQCPEGSTTGPILNGSWTPTSGQSCSTDVKLTIKGLVVGRKYRVTARGVMSSSSASAWGGAHCPYVTGVDYDVANQMYNTCPLTSGHCPGHDCSCPGGACQVKRSSTFNLDLNIVAVATAEELKLWTVHCSNYYYHKNEVVVTAVPVGRTKCKCPPGHAASDGQCRKCKPGSFSPQGLGCKLAPVGTYVPVEGAAKATPCAVSTYADSEGSIRCDTCPSGFTNSVVGQSSCSEKSSCMKYVAAPQNRAPVDRDGGYIRRARLRTGSNTNEKICYNLCSKDKQLLAFGVGIGETDCWCYTKDANQALYNDATWKAANDGTSISDWSHDTVKEGEFSGFQCGDKLSTSFSVPVRKVSGMSKCSFIALVSTGTTDKWTSLRNDGSKRLTAASNAYNVGLWDYRYVGSPGTQTTCANVKDTISDQVTFQVPPDGTYELRYYPSTSSAPLKRTSAVFSNGKLEDEIVWTEATYAKINKGTCESHGYTSIEKRAECHAASVSLGLKDNSIAGWGVPGRPHGCIYASNDWLSFAEDKTSTPCGTYHAGFTYSCLCAK